MAGKKRTFGSAVKTLFLVLNVLAALALLVSYTALYVDPRQYWPLAVFGLLYPIILALNLLFVILWIIFWKKYFLISLVTVLAGITQLLTLWPVRFSGERPVPPGSFRIVSYNIHGFRYPPKTGLANQEDILKFLSGLDPAIVCLQEFSPRGKETPVSLSGRLNLSYASFRNYYPDRRNSMTGLAIFSRFPVVADHFITDSRNMVFAMAVDVASGTDTFRLFNLHLASIRFGSGEVSFYDNLMNTEAEKIRLSDGFTRILEKLKKAFLMRSEQVDLLDGAVRKSPYPVIVAGDFNDTPFSFSYHRMTSILKDAYRQAGTGLFGNTYAGQLPSYRIDYILFDPGFHAYDYRRHVVPYSDHYPVSSFLSPLKKSG
jgi:endonuclease/exonuclease/phosphatase family metal-dependent hydrolase